MQMHTETICYPPTLARVKLSKTETSGEIARIDSLIYQESQFIRDPEQGHTFLVAFG